MGTPFPFEGPVAADLLIDRDRELALLARRAADRVNVRLAAPRRYGKTSLLLAHAGRLRQTGWQSVHVDLSRVADITDVARRVIAAYTPLDVSWVRSHLAAVTARLGVSIGAGGPSVTIGARPATMDSEAAETALLRLLDLPLRLWETQRTPTLVIFDEFQDLLVARKDLDGLLRSRIQYHGDSAAYVYAGSEPSMMRELFDGRERPFFGQADPLGLGPLPLDDVVTELSRRLDGEGLGGGEALGELAVLAAGHPQRTMLLCYLLSERLLDNAEATPALAAQVVDDALARTEPSHQALWGQLAASERAVAAAVADGVPPGSRALAAQHKLSRNALAAAADRLADHGHLIRRPPPARLVDPLLAEWLRRR